MTDSVRLDYIKSKVSLSQMFAEVTNVDRRGFALCPFHQEKTASCKVDDGKGFFYCFGCGAAGDAIDFVRKTENLSFPEAVERLASMAGMDADDCSYKLSRKEKAERDRQRAASLRKCEEKQRAREEATAVEALKMWEEAKPIDGMEHLYLQAKGVSALGLRITKKYFKVESSSENKSLHVSAGALVIPLHDVEGKLWSLQFFPPRPKIQFGEKWPRYFMPGGSLAFYIRAETFFCN